MTHVAPLLAVIFTSSLLTWSRAEASLSCASITVLDNSDVVYTFLRSDPPRLYSSSWSGQRALLSCAWSDDAALIQKYSSLCQERAHEFSDHPNEDYDVNSMFEDEDLCVSAGDSWSRERVGRRRSAEDHQGRAEGSEVRRLQRVKRGFIVPGTLWCGSGNKAPSYEDLGVFSDTDSCCREHDQCKHTILSFHSQFGVFNSNIFTMSHCDCDRKFHSCLTEANDSISDVVGYTFFNLLKMHCFEFSHRLQCTQRNWFGMCKETKLALYAEVHPPTEYDSPSPTEVSTNSSSVNTTSSTSHPAAASTVPPPSVNTTSSTSHPAAASTVPPPSVNTTSSTPQPPAASTVPPPSVNTTSSTPHPAAASTVPPPSVNTTSNTSHPAAASTVPPPSVNTTSSASHPAAASTVPPPSVNTTSSTSHPAAASTVTNTTEGPAGLGPESRDDLENILSSEAQLSCSVFKDLDECQNKIRPQQTRYGLQNQEATTLYHCNCTARLFQTLAKQRQLTDVQARLLGHVSPSCFLPRDCTSGGTCSAVVVRADLPRWSSGAVQMWRSSAICRPSD